MLSVGRCEGEELELLHWKMMECSAAYDCADHEANERSDSAADRSTNG